MHVEHRELRLREPALVALALEHADRLEQLGPRGLEIEVGVERHLPHEPGHGRVRARGGVGLGFGEDRRDEGQLAGAEDERLREVERDPGALGISRRSELAGSRQQVGGGVAVRALGGAATRAGEVARGARRQGRSDGQRELAAEADRLLEVPADDLVQLDERAAAALDPAGEALVQVGARPAWGSAS